MYKWNYIEQDRVYRTNTTTYMQTYLEIERGWQGTKPCYIGAIIMVGYVSDLVAAKSLPECKQKLLRRKYANERSHSTMVAASEYGISTARSNKDCIRANPS